MNNTRKKYKNYYNKDKNILKYNLYNYLDYSQNYVLLKIETEKMEYIDLINKSFNILKKKIRKFMLCNIQNSKVWKYCLCGTYKWKKIKPAIKLFEKNE